MIHDAAFGAAVVFGLYAVTNLVIQVAVLIALLYRRRRFRSQLTVVEQKRRAWR